MINSAEYDSRLITRHIDRLERTIRKANAALQSTGQPGVAIPKLPIRRR
jgi:hypothetical protein